MVKAVVQSAYPHCAMASVRYTQRESMSSLSTVLQLVLQYLSRHRIVKTGENLTKYDVNAVLCLKKVYSRNHNISRN